MTTNSLFRLGFYALVLINAVLIFLLVKGPSPGRPPIPLEKGTSLMKTIGEKLNLTSGQMDQYENMAKQHRQVMINLQEEQRPLLRSYFELLKSPIEQDSSDNLLTEILILERRKLTTTYSHFEELKTILTVDQADQFESIVDDILRVLLSGEKKLPPPPRDF
ncbi:MAG: hypothetical protein ACFB15_18510 [Cyclobacteriaceae bacterium]